jgi:hypothetical protein
MFATKPLNSSRSDPLEYASRSFSFMPAWGLVWVHIHDMTQHNHLSDPIVWLS